MAVLEQDLAVMGLGAEANLGVLDLTQGVDPEGVFLPPARDRFLSSVGDSISGRPARGVQNVVPRIAAQDVRAHRGRDPTRRHPAEWTAGRQLGPLLARACDPRLDLASEAAP